MNVYPATLKDGTEIVFVHVDDPPSGGMKMTYFTPDRKQVVQFFHDPAAAKDPQRLARLEAILSRYNPTIPEEMGGARGGNRATAEYFRHLFCWPTSTVLKPETGIVAPAYPDNYFFATGPFKGQEKISRWFSSPRLRKMLPPQEQGEWINYLSISILLSRAVRRLHQAGLAHSDLSSKNVLIDPPTGHCIVIDIDSLVVPRLFPPDVMGTPGYIAPEVLATQNLDFSDPGRHHPSARTDLHALAVLIYEYLLSRHPLKGPKVNSVSSAEEDEFLSMGSKALYIEHPDDSSNRPDGLSPTVDVLGPYLAELFSRAFVTGLHSPDDRPAAIEWERGLIKTWDLLLPCQVQACTHRWFILTDLSDIRCPFCSARYPLSVPVLKLRSERRTGQWMHDRQMAVYQNVTLFKWHVLDNVFPAEESDRTPQASFIYENGRWYLLNRCLQSLTSQDGNRIQAGQSLELKDGAIMRLSQEPHGRIAEVRIYDMQGQTDHE